MKWSEDRPTKPGKYWYYDIGEDTSILIRITLSRGKLYANGGELSWCFNHIEYCKDESCIHDKEWWGDQVVIPDGPFINLDFPECKCNNCRED